VLRRKSAKSIVGNLGRYYCEVEQLILDYRVVHLPSTMVTQVFDTAAMEPTEDQNPEVPEAANRPQSGAINIKLPSFWQESPVAWFKQVECVFGTKGVMDSLDKYCHVVAVLPPGTIRLIIDLV
jgi:hypothetical protein